MHMIDARMRMNLISHIMSDNGDLFVLCNDIATNESNEHRKLLGVHRSCWCRSGSCNDRSVC
jgi:hypothetical protein